MRPCLTFQVAPVELVQSLKRNAAIFFGAELSGDFLPRPALLSLLADELNERFEAAAISSPAAMFRLPSIFGFRVHRYKFNSTKVITVNKQWANRPELWAS